MTLLERLANIIQDWTGERREVRRSAIGWQPPGDEWQEDCGETASGNNEFFIVTRQAPKQENHEKQQ